MSSNNPEMTDSLLTRPTHCTDNLKFLPQGNGLGERPRKIFAGNLLFQALLEFKWGQVDLEHFIHLSCHSRSVWCVKTGLWIFLCYFIYYFKYKSGCWGQMSINHFTLFFQIKEIVVLVFVHWGELLHKILDFVDRERRLCLENKRHHSYLFTVLQSATVICTTGGRQLLCLVCKFHILKNTRATILDYFIFI